MSVDKVIGIMFWDVKPLELTFCILVTHNGYKLSKVQIQLVLYHFLINQLNQIFVQMLDGLNDIKFYNFILVDPLDLKIAF